MAKGKGAGQGGFWLEDKGKGKEVKLLLEAKGLEATFKLKDAAPKAKEAAPKPKEADPKATNLPVSQPGSKDDLYIYIYIYIYFFLYVIFLCYGSLPLFIMYSSFVQ